MATQTLKEYLTEPYSATDQSCLLDEVTTISQFRHDLKDIKSQASFASTRLTDPIAKAPRGYITLESIFNPKNCYDEEGHPESFVDNLDAFMDQYGAWEVSETAGDNTYNHCSPVEDYVNMNQVTIVNPDSEGFESKDLLFLSAGLGLDPRGGYTDSVIAIFDNDLDGHYNSDSFLIVRFDVISGSFTYYGKTFNYDVEATMADEDYFVNIYPDSDDDSALYPDDLNNEHIVNFDGSDKKEIKTALNDIMDQAYDSKDLIENLSVEYTSEMLD